MERLFGFVVISAFAVTLGVVAIHVVNAYVGAIRFSREADNWIKQGKCPGCREVFAPKHRQCARCGFWVVPPPG